MVKRYRLIFSVFLIVLIFVCLTGCSITNNHSPAAVARKQANTILKCIQENDADTLKSLFTPDIQQKPELDEQIYSFLNFIDGEIVSYSEPFGERGGGEYRYGETVYQKVDGSIRNIQTDTGKNYRINHSAIFINKNNPDNLGVYYMRIQDVDLIESDGGNPANREIAIYYSFD